MIKHYGYAKALLSASVLALGLGCTTGALAQWKPGDRTVLRVANSQPNQSIYAIGVSYKTILESKIPNLRLEIVATQGGDENTQLLMAKEVEIANANAVAPFAAHHGRFAYAGKTPNRKVVSFFPAYTWELGFMVPTNSPITSVRQLVGKRVATGPVGSGAELTFREMLAALGMTEASFGRVQKSAPQQGLGGMTAGTIDAVFWGTAHPAGVIMERVATSGLKFINFEKAELDKVAAAYPYYHPGSLPANTYKGQTQPAAWIGGSSHFWIHADVDEQLVYQVVKALWENRAVIKKSHSSQEFLDENLVRQQAGLLPFHRGAARYFKEAGILK